MKEITRTGVEVFPAASSIPITIHIVIIINIGINLIGFLKFPISDLNIDLNPEPITFPGPGITFPTA